MESSFSPSSDLFLVGVCSLHEPVLAVILRSCQSQPCSPEFFARSQRSRRHSTGQESGSLVGLQHLAGLFVGSASCCSMATAAWTLLCLSPGGTNLPGHVFYCVCVKIDPHFLSRGAFPAPGSPVNLNP